MTLMYVGDEAQQDNDAAIAMCGEVLNKGKPLKYSLFMNASDKVASELGLIGVAIQVYMDKHFGDARFMSRIRTHDNDADKLVALIEGIDWLQNSDIAVFYGNWKEDLICSTIHQIVTSFGKTYLLLDDNDIKPHRLYLS